MLQVPGVNALSLAEILSEPLKSFPPQVLSALPSADLSGVVVPSLYKDHNRHLCVLVSVGRKYAACVPFVSSGFRVVRVPVAQFAYAFRPTSEPLERALEAYRRNVKQFGATKEALQYLGLIEKEIQMLNVVIVKGKVKESFNSKKDAEAFVSGLGEKSEALIVDGAAALSAVGTVADLTSVYNSVSSKSVKKLESKNEKVLARVWDAIVAKCSNGHDKDADAPKARTVRGKSTQGDKSAEGPREGSKMAKLLKVLQNGGGDLDKLSKASGYDEKNTRTAIGILRSGRVAGGKKYEVKLDRDSGKYACA